MRKQRKNNFRKPHKPQNPHRINEHIRISEVRLVGDNVPNSGDVVSTDFARNLAKELELDLVEVNASQNPSICKIVDYAKFLYEEKKQKKEHEKKQKEKQKDLKEMQFTPNIGEADKETKMKKVKEFIEKGHKVKLRMKFKGGRMFNNSRDNGELILLQIAETLQEVAKAEGLPKLNGLNMFMTLAPKK